MGELDGRVALVTGGGSGIGAACVRRLVADSAKVIVADIDEAAAGQVAEEIGEGAVAMQVDVTDPDAVDRLVADAHGVHGRLDIGLNIAGVGGSGGLPGETSTEIWRQVVDVNLSGVFYCMRAELRYMVEVGRGSIVNMASIYGLVGTPKSIAYVAAKHGVVGLTKSAGLAYAGRGVRINAVAPAVIDTPLVARSEPDVLAGILAQHPTGRMGQAEEVAEMVAFLASDRSSYCTGGVYAVDGAFTAG